MSSSDTTSLAEAPRRGAGRDKPVAVLVLAALAWGLLVIVGALTIPIVTAQSTGPAVPAPSAPTSSPAPQPPATGTVQPSPRTTIVHADGAKGVAVASVPAVTSLLVGGLLGLERARRRKAIHVLAWTLSVGLLLASIVGFLTFLVGLAGVPSGVLLVLACSLTARIHSRGQGMPIPTSE